MKPQDLISKYIQGTLTVEEQQEFDTLLNTDQNFRDEVLFHTNLKKVVEHKDDNDFRHLLSDLESNVKKKKTLKWWYAAAAILVLLGTTYFWNTKKPVSNDELFATYFKPYRNILQPVVRSGEHKNMISVAFNAYENGNFKKALDAFDIVLETEANDTLQFYKANALLKLNKAKKAIIILENRNEIKNSFSEKNHWYLAMAYLKVGQLDKAKEQLELLIKIPDSEYKRTEAKELLKKLN
ncbi:tetratricopeptide repeat protein [Aquimarina megaterium]|uniref:tetratricopeptide repeat protein n=1 Tax=Aquimarina megaterium TaxID=1443666 RepID=UPI00047283EA|nr:tetratricopeptide repeat protein [Aquimarina megaterium]